MPRSQHAGKNDNASKDDLQTKKGLFNLLMLSPIPSADYAADAFLRAQYLPSVRNEGEELPPYFSSDSFSDKAAEELAKLAAHRACCPIEYRTRRFDGLVRIMGLPHPVPYARLVHTVKTHWDDLVPKLLSTSSMIKPSFHADHRLVTMDYGTSVGKTADLTRAAQGKQYLVEADISNCFPSMYTHAVDWALRTKPVAKTNRNSGWEHELDQRLQSINDGETKGILIGPVISNVISELVLQRVDEQIRKINVSFVRNIDDYTAFFRTRQQAELFVAQLETELSEYRLHLNAKKTHIESTRHGIGERWINEINSYMPKSRGALGVVRFLQQSEALAMDFPQRSVVRYAAKAVLSRRRHKRPNHRDVLIIDELLRISFFHPEILCFLVGHIQWAVKELTAEDKDRISVQLLDQMSEAIRRRETDSMLWAIFGIQVLHRARKISRAHCDGLIATDDDLVWSALATVSQVGRRRVRVAVQTVDKNDHEAREHHWLSRYELFRVGDLALTSLHPDEVLWFNVAIGQNVAFTQLQ